MYTIRSSSSHPLLLLPPASHQLRSRADQDEEPRKDQIDKSTLEIKQVDDEVYTSMRELGEELPDNSPRFVVLSYPLTLVRSPLSQITGADVQDIH